MTEFERGVAHATAEIAAWHTKQAQGFAGMAKAMERDKAEAERWKWAASSHHAHATAIGRMKL